MLYSLSFGGMDFLLPNQEFLFPVLLLVVIAEVSMCEDLVEG